MKIKGLRQRTIEGTIFPIHTKPRDSLQKICGKKRIAVFKIILLIITAAIIITIFNLQIIRGDYYRTLAERNRIRVKEIKPLRGLIYDRNQTLLVINEANFALLATPYDLYQHDFSTNVLKAKLNELYPDSTLGEELIKKLANYSYVPIVLKKNLTYEEGIKIIPIIEDWPGVFLQESFKRKYLFGDIMSHILGYTSFVSNFDLSDDDFYSISDIIGKTGIEASTENRLRGSKGQKKVQVNSFGKETKIIDYASSTKGENITLTIDLEIQTKLTEILHDNMLEFGVSRAVGIIINPKNGEIIALISLPSFDNNIFTTAFDQTEYNQLINDPNKPLFNRSIAGEYPPGSTFKLIVGIGALEEQIIHPATTILSTGGIRIGEWFFPDWAAGGHGAVNMRGAIAWSVNTYFYTVGGGHGTYDGLGLSGISKYAKMFNLGNTTGIEIPGEATGFIPTSEWKLAAKGERWYLGDTYHLAIGQGDILVTPLQMAIWTSFFANDGTLYQPHIIKSTTNTIDKNFISSKNTEVIKKGMRDAVVSGSTTSLNNLPVAVAGKTGSAQFSQIKKPHGWFTGFAPYENPEIVITILMEEGDGAKSAVPVARDFFEWYFGARIKTPMIST